MKLKETGKVEGKSIEDLENAKGVLMRTFYSLAEKIQMRNVTKMRQGLLIGISTKQYTY